MASLGILLGCAVVSASVAYSTYLYQKAKNRKVVNRHPKGSQMFDFYQRVYSWQFFKVWAAITASFILSLIVDIVVLNTVNDTLALTLELINGVVRFAIGIYATLWVYRLFIKK